MNAYNRDLDVEMNSLKPEIIQLYKQREQHQTWLLSHGARVEDINRLGRSWSREGPEDTSSISVQMERCCALPPIGFANRGLFYVCHKQFVSLLN